MTDIEILLSAARILRREQKKVPDINNPRYGMLDEAIEMLHETRNRLEDIVSHG